MKEFVVLEDIIMFTIFYSTIKKLCANVKELSSNLCVPLLDSPMRTNVSLDAPSKSLFTMVLVKL